MQIVISIPNSLYANMPKIQNDSIAAKRILDCVKNGTPLPKGHGNLIERNKVLDALHTTSLNKALKKICEIPVIIEAEYND